MFTTNVISAPKFGTRNRLILMEMEPAIRAHNPLHIVEMKYVKNRKAVLRARRIAVLVAPHNAKEKPVAPTPAEGGVEYAEKINTA